LQSKRDMAKRREIRNSTAEFLIFQIEGKEQGIVERADAEQEHMGLTTWENAPDGKRVQGRQAAVAGICHGRKYSM